MIINDKDYDIDELAAEYGSMRNFMMNLNCDGTVIFNNDPSLYQIDYFDGSQFREIYTIDLPFTEYEDHGICSADIRKIGGIGGSIRFLPYLKYTIMLKNGVLCILWHWALLLCF